MSNPIRTSFGQHVYRDIDRDCDYSVCRGEVVFPKSLDNPVKSHNVEMNGVGSSATWYAHVAHMISHSVWEDLFRVILPAADKHDMIWHRGFIHDSERRFSDKIFRLDCLDLIDVHFKMPMKHTSRLISKLYSEYGDRPSWWQIIFSAQKREYWKVCRNHDEMIRQRKNWEMIIEFLYTMLKCFGKANCKMGRCWERDLSKEKDVW